MNAEKTLPELLIEGVHHLPHLKEFLLCSSVFGFLDEVSPECLNDLDLFFFKAKKLLVYLFQVFEIIKQQTGIDKILIDIVEVAQYHLAPKQELVERLVAMADFDIDLIQQEQ